ncbi:MAG: hypothetical protein MUE87_06190, partial [Methanothrix sp.]|nr:hypothetical protein [Methanothrix sp.]
DIITLGGDIKLITANKNGTAYKMVDDYEKGSVLVIEARTKQSTDKDTRSRLSPMGTEFELQVLSFLNALAPDIQSRLKGNCDPACPNYRSTIMQDGYGSSRKLVFKASSKKRKVHHRRRWKVGTCGACL